MIDFHTHSLFSDGVLGPAELVRRAFVKGYRAIGIADHVDGSNLDYILPRLIKVSRQLNNLQDTYVIPGIEITHAPPAQISQLTAEARNLGAAIVVVHGESPVEPVAPGTNLAAIEAGADILAHPGFITEKEALLAVKNKVHLEITARSGHNITNGHVARISLETGANMVINTDAHAPGDLISRREAMNALIGAGLKESQAQNVFNNNEELLELVKKRLSSI